MKKIKTKVSLSIALSKDVKQYLKNNIENSSKYIEYLIIEDLIKNGVMNEKLIY